MITDYVLLIGFTLASLAATRFAIDAPTRPKRERLVLAALILLTVGFAGFACELL